MGCDNKRAAGATPQRLALFCALFVSGRILTLTAALARHRAAALCARACAPDGAQRQRRARVLAYVSVCALLCCVCRCVRAAPYFKCDFFRCEPMPMPSGRALALRVASAARSGLYTAQESRVACDGSVVAPIKVSTKSPFTIVWDKIWNTPGIGEIIRVDHMGTFWVPFGYLLGTF